MQILNSKWLALETSTDTLSLAVARDGQLWTHTGAGGAQTSATMLPQTLALLAEANLKLHDLDAVVFGRGPGAFTGLRTACAVAQGLAFGADLQVLPIDTLLAVAEEARHTFAHALTHAQIEQQKTNRTLVVMDARMDQVYVGAYEYLPNVDSPYNHNLAGAWRCVQEPALQSPDSLSAPVTWESDSYIAAGNAWDVYATRWPTTLTANRVRALPTAAALVRLAPQAWAAGMAVPPEQALPVYVRDKVAQTTDERMQAKLTL